MKKHLFTIIFLSVFVGFSQTQQQDSIQTTTLQQNAAQRILSGNVSSGVVVGGYGEITYNQPEADNGELDVQRLVLLFGYNFSEKVQFVTEIELEHVEEVFVEQAFINYNVSNNFILRGGLLLIPMGIVNEFHEPTTFNGVERPSIDGAIVPTTWREIGVGVFGRFNDIPLSYQAYVINGFQSIDEDGNGLIGGSSGLRGGRQKAIKSTINTPNITTKLDYYGILGLRLGFSTYFGRTQSPNAFNDVDGSDVGVSMIGFDMRYNKKRFTARGQFIYAALSDTEDYNTLTGDDLGAALSGWYLEAAYNLLPLQNKQRLFAFARYEKYNTHAKTDGGLLENDAYNRNETTIGLSYHIANGAVVKADYQIKNDAVDGTNPANQLNFGIGVWF